LLVAVAVVNRATRMLLA